MNDDKQLIHQEAYPSSLKRVCVLKRRFLGSRKHHSMKTMKASVMHVSSLLLSIHGKMFGNSCSSDWTEESRGRHFERCWLMLHLDAGWSCNEVIIQIVGHVISTLMALHSSCAPCSTASSLRWFGLSNYDHSQIGRLPASAKEAWYGFCFSVCFILIWPTSWMQE